MASTRSNGKEEPPLAQRPLWTHKDPRSTRMWAFKTQIEERYGLKFPDYESLRQWSITDLESFWKEVWHFTGIRASKSFTKAVENDGIMFPRPAFFPGARLNFAENLLYPHCSPTESSLAVIAVNETSREEITWAQLRERVRLCSNAMREFGVVEGDRVAGFLANHDNALVAMLSTTTVGAIWTGVSPDNGVHAVLDRLQQIQPKMLFSDNAVMYNSKIHEVNDKLAEITASLPELQAAIVFETILDHPFRLGDVKLVQGKALMYSDFISRADQNRSLEFVQLPPEHPIYILYSSGTTGKPKCILHSALGTLIQHKKEHEIHGDIGPGSRFCQFTTISWMMHHWLVSGLASGATIVLYDGSPFRPLDASGNGELAMPRLIDTLGITHFGTSAKYLSMLEQKDTLPKVAGLPMEKLRAIYSTGSPLAPSTFRYVYRAFGPDLNLGSITGGTDIISLFGAPATLCPVYAGEIQVRGLGMAVEAWDSAGKDITASGEPGDLVCTRPFPCQPVGFWGDDEAGSKYRGSYFEVFPGIWHHGDFVRINPQTGGMVMLGRSDGVLKPAGVRFGSAEIYNVVLKHFAAEVEDALCVGRRQEHDVDENVVLFLKMAPGFSFNAELSTLIKGIIRSELSARHVPAIVDSCPAIPVTTNGKKVEIAVKQILCGITVKTSASVANADCLDWYRKWNLAH